MASALRPTAETCGTPPQPFSHPKQGVQQDAISTDIGSLKAMSVDSEGLKSPVSVTENQKCSGYCFFVL